MSIQITKPPEAACGRRNAIRPAHRMQAHMPHVRECRSASLARGSAFPRSRTRSATETQEDARAPVKIVIYDI